MYHFTHGFVTVLKVMKLGRYFPQYDDAVDFFTTDDYKEDDVVGYFIEEDFNTAGDFIKDNVVGDFTEDVYVGELFVR